MSNKKVMFMGTPDIAAVSLKHLLDNNIDVCCVVTQPDKPKGRGHKLMPTDVKVVALEHNIPCFQPERLKEGQLQPILDEFKPDIIAVVAYGKILPEYIIDYPKFGCVNMHASLLPKYRGAAPIQWSVINGDEYTGVTTMKMDIGLDTGDMLLAEKTKIGEYETSEELFDRIAVIGAKALLETLVNYEDITPQKQDDENSTYAQMLSKEMGHIEWNNTKEVISKKICGMNSWPLAYSMLDDEIVKIITAKKCAEILSGVNGQIIRHEKGKGLLVKCENGGIWLEIVQFAGKKKMHIDDYLLGHTIEIGKILK